MENERVKSVTTALREPDQVVVLRDVQWETYERLLADQEGCSAPRLNYDCGILEIMSPSPNHEKLKEAVALLFQLVAAEMELDFVALGSTTFRRPDLLKGFEPDACFYVTNADAVRAKDKIDLAVDPPPELVIEIEVTNPVLNKLSLYSAAGVRELWLYVEDHFEIMELDADMYVRRGESSFLPRVTGAVLTEFSRTYREMKSTAWIKSLRDWAAKG